MVYLTVGGSTDLARRLLLISRLVGLRRWNVISLTRLKTNHGLINRVHYRTYIRQLIKKSDKGDVMIRETEGYETTDDIGR